MIGRNLCALFLSMLVLSGCIPDHWPEAWKVQARPVYDKQPPPWCYRSLAKIDCYAQPLKGATADHQITATLPPPQDPAPTILNPAPVSVVTPAPAAAKPVIEQTAPLKMAAKKKPTHKKVHKKPRSKTMAKNAPSAACPPCDTSKAASPPAAPPAPPQVPAASAPEPAKEQLPH